MIWEVLHCLWRVLLRVAFAVMVMLPLGLFLPRRWFLALPQGYFCFVGNHDDEAVNSSPWTTLLRCRHCRRVACETHYYGD